MYYNFIEYYKGKIKVYDFSSDDIYLDLLKKDGEEEQVFIEEEFWLWWKNKMNYQGEKTMFVICSDKEKFDIPEDINIIKVDDIDMGKVKKVEGYLAKSNIVLTYPELEALKDKIKKHKVSPKVEKTIAKKGSIASYFERQTEVIKTR